jgi:hypothetical protein
MIDGPEEHAVRDALNAIVAKSAREAMGGPERK